jgi:phage protein U
MFALLGDILFQVVNSPDSIESLMRWDYAEHRVIESSPVLQWVGDDLERLDLGMLLHKSVSDPLTSLTLLRTAADTHIALPLVLGNGQVVGIYVIISMTVKMEQLSAVGDLIATEVRLRLKEWSIEAELAAGNAPLPSFVPVAISGANTSIQVTQEPGGSSSGLLPGVSVLLNIVPPSAPEAPNLDAGDVPTSVITRSATD